MSAPEEQAQEIRHRPLPSVDIALLPNEVRAARLQRLAMVGGALAVVLTAVGLSFGPSLLVRQAAHKDPAPWPSELTPATAPLVQPSAPSPAPAPEHEAAAVAASAAASKGDAPSAEPSDDSPIETETSAQPTATAAAAAEPAAANAPADGSPRVEHKFGDARSFKDAARKAGASADEANQLIAAFEKLIDFRHCRPEHVLVLERDFDKQLTSFEYRMGPTEIFRATRTSAGKLRGQKVDVPIERRPIAKGAYLAGTLGSSLSAMGLGAALAGVVIEAFDAKISFKRDARAGDSVKIMADEEYVNGTFLRYGVVHAIEYTSERAGKLQAFWFEKEHGDGDFYDSSGRAMHGGWLRTPLRYDHISSGYNLRRKHPILKRIMPHQGIDYSAGTGTPVWAAAEGVVTFAGRRGPNGNLVSIKHGNGYESHYAHLWRIAAGIRTGVHVKQRHVIGYVGTTGRSTGPHLHFALKRNDHFLDPATQLNGPGQPLPAGSLPRFKTLAQRLRADLDRIPLASAPKGGGAPASEASDDTADEEVIDL